MAAYPFRKMTNRQLRKLLKDEKDRDELLKMPPVRQAETSHEFSPLQNQPIPTCKQSESINR